MSDQSKALRGGEFLIRETTADAIFIPEEWTEEHRMMLQTGLDFVAQRIIPNLERIVAGATASTQIEVAQQLAFSICSTPLVPKSVSSFHALDDALQPFMFVLAQHGGVMSVDARVRAVVAAHEASAQRRRSAPTASAAA